MKRLHNQFKKYRLFALVGLILVLLSAIPVRLAIASHQAPRPQAFLVLGGDPKREEFTAEIAKYYPSLDIWVSTGSPPDRARAIFQAADIPDSRVHLDYRAADTVTNFTTLVADFQKRQIKHVYLVTSEFHMPRSKTIATLVLGSQGITFTPLSVPSSRPRESKVRILRDGGRALLWIVTGRTGVSLNPRAHNPLYASR
ncbi:MAG: YdcF family protein [Goleter apudmare HA4340-LM2]|nr:YdcF family protein [Goleter apudmare HA4340-LM2]